MVKPATPFGNVPLLEVTENGNTYTIAQSMAIGKLRTYNWSYKYMFKFSTVKFVIWQDNLI